MSVGKKFKGFQKAMDNCKSKGDIIKDLREF